MDKKEHRSDCLFSCTTDLLGDKWSLLIIRDIMFYDKHTYNEFLLSAEKISTNILAARLVALENCGILKKETLSAGKSRSKYSLTEKGIDLLPVMIEIFAWAAKYFPLSDEDTKRLKKIETSKKQVIKKLTEKLKNGE